MLPPKWTLAAPFARAGSPLRQPGSLTARLARGGTVSIDLLGSGWADARPDEIRKLGFRHAKQRLYAREVCIRRNGTAVILARSVTTAVGAKGPWHCLDLLGDRPLATVLWANPRICRGPFEYARLPTDDPLVRRIAVKQSLLARRSSFWLQDHQLIVLEAFIGLPWPPTGDHDDRCR